jgi:pilus assembly protein TadC
VLLTCLLLAAAAAVAALPRPRRPLPLRAPVGAEARRAERTAAEGAPEVRHLLPACLLAAVAVAWVVGGAVGLVLGVAVVIGGPRLLAGLEPAAARERRRRLADDLPLALDLLAACLAGGATLPQAAASVGAALGGPVGRRLDRVAAALAVGSPVEEAWAALAGASPPGPADSRHRPTEPDPLAPAARALARAARAGAPVVSTLARLAQDARAAGRSRAELAARRAGVLAVVPLGLCFLPAFVLLGVVPVVAGLVGPMLASF